MMSFRGTAALPAQHEPEASPQAAYRNKRNVVIDKSPPRMSYFGLGIGSSTGAPDFFHSEKPPLMCATGLSPIRCAVCAASAERQPPAQKNTNFLSSANCGL